MIIASCAKPVHEHEYLAELYISFLRELVTQA